MKKIFLTFATAALFSVSAFAGVVGHSDAVNSAIISSSVLNSFDADFTDAKDVVWSRTMDCQKAEFLEDGKKQTAFYSLSGDFLGTTQALDYSILPAKTKEKIAEKYKGYVADGVILYQANTAFNDAIDPTTYFVVIKNDAHSILLRITNEGNIAFFKQIK